MTGEIKDLSVVQNTRSNANSSIKELYYVMVEDPTVKAKSRTHVATRVDMGSATAVMVGYEIVDRKNLESIIAQIKNKSYNDALELVKTASGEDLEVITIPWNKVIRIKTMKFTVTKQ